MKAALKRLLRAVVRDYEINRVYHRTPVLQDAAALPPGACVIESRAQFDDSSDARIRDHAWFFGDKARVYGLYDEGDLVCICAYWFAGHAGLPHRFAELAGDEAVMVDLLTSPKSRGRGHASQLARHAENDLVRLGKRRLVTWVWHNNAPSIRVFEKAGWSYSHLLVEIRPRGMERYLRFSWPARRPATHAGSTDSPGRS